MVNLGWINDHLQFSQNQAHLSIQEFEDARILASWNHVLFARPLLPCTWASCMLIYGSQIRDIHTVMMQPCNKDQGCMFYVMQSSLKVLRQLGPEISTCRQFSGCLLRDALWEHIDWKLELSAYGILQTHPTCCSLKRSAHIHIYNVQF